MPAVTGWAATMESTTRLIWATSQAEQKEIVDGRSRRQSATHSASYCDYLRGDQVNNVENVRASWGPEMPAVRCRSSSSLRTFMLLRRFGRTKHPLIRPFCLQLHAVTSPYCIIRFENSRQPLIPHDTKRRLLLQPRAFAIYVCSSRCSCSLVTREPTGNVALVGRLMAPKTVHLLAVARGPYT
ncbi:hypothetical protein FA95DRAFT_694998 [Auriscalpium vulgare]|uniref:Uncharacterized protein n=1 Tax=Auriscalpium vulgare TaxID=40419 RepID=A0ACB8RCP0_9AGAM|nr:hypothetical protein FA95DRAFT_694998 [Auriscalpium vulgare]